MRRKGLRVALLIAAGALAGAAPASATKLVTLTTTSRYVDPTKVAFNKPPGAADRPPALRVNVLLPDGYDGKRRFPVLYLLHGHGDAYDSWMNPQQGDVAHVAKGLAAIIVMPEGDKGWYTNWWSGGARSPGWESYHLEELVPLIERRFRVRPGRRWHAIAGLSMGGEGAIYYAEERPGYFGSAASFSGVLSIQRPEWPFGFDTQGEHHVDVYGDPDAQRFYWTGHNPTALADNLRYTRVFVAVGDGTPAPGDPISLTAEAGEAELRQQAQDFVGAAQQFGVNLTYHPHQGIHEWNYWRKYLGEALLWGFFKSVPATPREWKFDTVQTRAHAWGFGFAFKKPPATVESFQASGRRLDGAGSGKVRVRAPGGVTFTRTLPFSVIVPSHKHKHKPKPKKHDSD